MSAALIFGQSRAQLAGFGSTKFSNPRVPVLIEVYNNFCIASIIIIIDYQILAIEMFPADERHLRTELESFQNFRIKSRIMSGPEFSRGFLIVLLNL